MSGPGPRSWRNHDEPGNSPNRRTASRGRAGQQSHRSNGSRNRQHTPQFSGDEPRGVSRRGRGGYNRREQFDVRNLNSSDLEKLVQLSSDDLVNTLLKQKSQFEQLLNSRLTPDLMVATVRVLANLCRGNFIDSITSILTRACSNTFLESLENFLTTLPFEKESVARQRNKLYWENINRFWQNLEELFKKMIDLFPSKARDELTGVLSKTNVIIANIEGNQDYAICRDVKTSLSNMSEALQKQLEKFEAKTAVHVVKPKVVEKDPPENFRLLSVVPMDEDLFDSNPFIRANKVTEPYDSVEHYLDVQFRLLREDFISPLRDGLNEYLSQPTQRRNKNVRIYRRVTFLPPEQTKRNSGHTVFFGVKKIDWNDSKRLMYGGLLCLSKDGFNTFLFATVVDRDAKELSRGVLHIKLCEQNPIAEDFYDHEFIMLEAKLYYEPYFVVLNALRHMYERNFPMKIYLVDANTAVKRPRYLEDETIKLTYDEFELPIDVNEAWPSPEELKLDEMQYQAFKCALTEEFSVIQGPPGTGKTFLALQIIRTMLSNSKNWCSSGPIIVLCLTNHALDQFLEGILNYTESIVRVGSRSKSPRLSECSIKNLRPEPKPRPPPNLLRFKKRWEQYERDYNGSRHRWYRDEAEDESDEEYPDEYRQYRRYRRCLDEWEAKYSLELQQAQSTVGRAHGLLNDDLHNVQMTEELICSLNEANALVSVWQLRKYCQDPILIDLKNNHALLKWLLGDNFVTPQPRQVEQSWLENFSERILSQCNSAVAYPLDCIDEIIAEIQSEIKYYKRRFEEAYELPFDPTIDWQYDIYELQHLRSYLERMLAHHPLVRRGNRTHCDHPNWRLYWQWVTICHEVAVRDLRQSQIEIDYDTQSLKQAKERLDLRIMQERRVVGLTTTAAARLHSTLRALKSPIVLVEEAAEILEAHIVCSLTNSCQHMILIGDHKQLRPKAAVYKLGTKYNLNISLFERMVNIRGNHTQLARQHRMRPEIAKLICPSIYETLHNHESVCNYPSVKGLTKNMFFLHHTHPEVVSDFNEDSWKNPHEAQFLVAFARHLTLQGYDVSEITLLCTYAGQLTELKEERKSYRILQELRIETIDNYQGEENKIILLSLVRNNEEGNIGFLKEENRVCVGLSRAREGLYVMGNMNNLTSNNDIWPKIKQVLEEDNAIGNSVELQCHIHPGEITHARDAKDFEKCPEGGCLKICNAELSCGHVCQIVCHILDRKHENYRCNKPCLQTCPKGHTCPLTCWQGCESCLVLEDRELPCGHTVSVPCGADSDTYPCPVMIDAILPDCNHMVVKPCHEPVRNYPCSQPCEVRGLCGHSCTLTCHVNNDPDHLQYKCEKECTKNNLNCTMDHPCLKQCGEECTPCDIERKKERSCGHYFNCKCSQDVEEVPCTKPCKRQMDCGHACQLKCNETCGQCKVKVEKMSSCGHQVTVKCCEEASPSNCSLACQRTLACGHSCTAKCRDPCTTTCRNMIQQTEPGLCGHLFSVPCHIKDCGDPHKLLRYCREPCTEELACGHKCKGNCGLCKQGRIHAPCAENCGNILICGHKCEVPCRQECPPCKKRCELRCRHNKCNRKCGEPCVPCKEKCGLSCPHSKCSKRCSELCDIKPCEEPCSTVLKCGHKCIGFCGDTCPKLCRICDKVELMDEFFLGHEEEPNARFVLLEDCGHCIESQGLLRWISQCSDSIQMKTCPRCKTLITKCMRVMNQLKTDIKDVQLVKKKIFGDQAELKKEQQQLLKELELMSLDPVLKHRNIVSSDLKNFVDSLKSKVCPITNNKRKQRQILDVRAIEATKITVNILQGIFQELKNIDHAVKIYPWLEDQICMLVQALSLTIRGQISNQEVSDIEPELRRLHYMAELCKMNPETSLGSNESLKHQVAYVDLVEKLTSVERFSKPRELDIKNEMGKLAPVFGIMGERKMIVKAMGFKQGHWYKCPNGHIYSIGDCGGAMQQSKCNECGAAIGGASHRLISNNSSATEMDEAIRSAWPNGI